MNKQQGEVISGNCVSFSFFNAHCISALETAFKK